MAVMEPYIRVTARTLHMDTPPSPSIWDLAVQKVQVIRLAAMAADA